jgi:hypothetical protein
LRPWNGWYAGERLRCAAGTRRSGYSGPAERERTR